MSLHSERLPCFQRAFGRPALDPMTLVTLPRVTVAATMQQISFGGNLR
jgi:hypothetical protein